MLLRITRLGLIFEGGQTLDSLLKGEVSFLDCWSGLGVIHACIQGHQTVFSVSPTLLCEGTSLEMKSCKLSFSSSLSLCSLDYSHLLLNNNGVNEWTEWG